MDFRMLMMLFIEGILAFISPCFLPMIPVYISYLAGHREKGDNGNRNILINGLGFILGFTVIFVILGMSATALSQFLLRYRDIIMRVGGVILIIFGLNMMEVLKLGFLNRDTRFLGQTKADSFLSAFLFGIVIAFGWSPCLGSFLTAALMTAASAETFIKGGIMLLVFSLGLGIPFLITAVLFNSFSSLMDGIKRNYRIINIISGVFLIVMGILMITGRFIDYATLFY